MSDIYNSGPISPISDPLLNPNAYVPATSSSLNVSKDTLIQSAGTSSTGIVLDASNPNLSILGFADKIGKALLDQKKSQHEFEVTTYTYEDYYRSIAQTAAQLRAVISAYSDFENTYNTYIDDLNSFLTTLRFRIDGLQAAYNTPTNGLTFQQTWGYAANAADNLVNTTTTTQAQTDALIADFNQARTWYNSFANNLNGVGTPNTSRIDEINNFINANVPGLQARANAINLTIASLGLTGVTPIPSLTTGPLRIRTINPYPLISTAVPPPWPPNLYFDSSDPRSTQPKADDPPTAGQLQVPPVASPPLPGDPIYDAPNPINHGDFVDAYIDPLVQSLDELSKKLKKVKNELSYQEVNQVIFGQATIGEVTSTPQPKNVEVSSSGSSANSNLLGSQAGKNTRLAEKFSTSQLQNIYNVYGIPQGSPLIPNIDGYSVDVLRIVLLKAISEAGKIAQEGLIGVSAADTPATKIALAAAALKEGINFTQSGATEAVILNLLLTDPALAGKSIEQLKGIAQGLAAALNLILLKNLLLNLGQSLGLPGLLSQLLVTSDTLPESKAQELINQKISYQNIYDSPLDQLLLRQSVVSTLPEPEVPAAVNRALEDVQSFEPFPNEDTARTTLQNAISTRLQEVGIPPDRAQEAVNQALPQDGTLPLNDQQILLSNLKESAFDTDLKSRLLKADQNNQDINRAFEQAQLGNQQNATLEERAQAILASLEKAGVENAAPQVQASLDTVNNPLKSPFVPETIPPEVLTQNLVQTTTNLLINQGIPAETAQQQAVGLGELLFSAEPGSARNLIRLYTTEYSQNVQQTQTETAESFFKDSIRPTLSTAAFLERIVDPANTLLFASNPIFYGNAAIPRTGPAGGVPINPIISV